MMSNIIEPSINIFNMVILYKEIPYIVGFIGIAIFGISSIYTICMNDREEN